MRQRGTEQGPSQVAEPEDACSPIKSPPRAQQGFIALITRSEQLSDACSFDVKARLHTADNSQQCVSIPVTPSGTCRSGMQRSPVRWQP